MTEFHRLLPDEDPKIPVMPIRIKDGYLYRHRDHQTERLSPWPDPAYWVSDDERTWTPHTPVVDLSAVDVRHQPFSWQGFHEAEAWATVPDVVVRSVIDAHLHEHQWDSLVLFATVPEALELCAELPILSAVLAVPHALQRTPSPKPHAAIRELLHAPKGMRRWRAIAGWLNLPPSKAFVNALRRVVSPPVFPVGVEHILALRDAWAHLWGRKLICHCQQLDRSNLGLLMAAMGAGRLHELRPGLLTEAYNQGDDSRIAWRFERLCRSWELLHPGAPLPRIDSAVALLIAEEDLREAVAERYRVDTSPRHPPSDVFPVPPISGVPGIEPLSSADALRGEGQAMAHCLISEANEESVRRREGYGYRVDTPEGRATVWLVPDGNGGVRLEQVRGRLNQEVPAEVMASVKAWFAEMSMEVSEAWRDAKPVRVEFERVPDGLLWATGGCPF
jgi:hypothetical protein